MVLDLRPKGGKCHCCHIWGNIEEFFVVVIFFKDGSSGGRKETTFVESAFSQGFL